MLAEALSVSRHEARVMSAVAVNHRSVVVGVPDQLFEEILVRVEVFPSVEAFETGANAMRVLAPTCV
jgi:hypothetical protein